MTMTNKKLAEAVARLTTINVVRGKDIDDMQSIIRQLWAEREQQRAVMAQAKEALQYYRDEEWLGGEDGVAAQAHAALESMGA